MRFAWVWVLVAGCGIDPVHQLPDAAAIDSVGDPCVGAVNDDLEHGIDRWTVTQTTPGLFTVTTDPTGLHVAKTGVGPGGYQSVAFTLNPLQPPTLGAEIATFTLSVDFANAVIGPSEDQIELHPIFDDSSTFFAVYSDHGGAGRQVHVWDGSSVQVSMGTTATGGTLQVDRENGPVTARFSGTTISSNPQLGRSCGACRSC